MTTQLKKHTATLVLPPIFDPVVEELGEEHVKGFIQSWAFAPSFNEAAVRCLKTAVTQGLFPQSAPFINGFSALEVKVGIEFGPMESMVSDELKTAVVNSASLESRMLRLTAYELEGYLRARAERASLIADQFERAHKARKDLPAEKSQDEPATIETTALSNTRNFKLRLPAHFKPIVNELGQEKTADILASESLTMPFNNAAKSWLKNAFTKLAIPECASLVPADPTMEMNVTVDFGSAGNMASEDLKTAVVHSNDFRKHVIDIAASRLRQAMTDRNEWSVKLADDLRHNFVAKDSPADVLHLPGFGTTPVQALGVN